MRNYRTHCRLGISIFVYYLFVACLQYSVYLVILVYALSVSSVRHTGGGFPQESAGASKTLEDSPAAACIGGEETA